ncbi:adventurous gliding motility protein GltG [Vulgatibacter incomptus]|uniref:Putative abductin-like protein n=1 Tax=Vulgatibacter incomptus TaxID=1391653 RepID=A0A0K1PCS8_9BACT|nr:adventurous gliding motility protein GltG [Vulgatibacter incomptus]AKU91307.1 putative abductin-like protein [Vulgatibacter incomptus]
MAIPLKLRVFRGGELVATKEFHRDIIKIGRLATAHLSLDDERVSRVHAVIEVAADGFSVIDMGSVEGTFVNGKRVSKAALSSGDSIFVGDTRIELEVCSEQPAANAVAIGSLAVATAAVPVALAPAIAEAPPAATPVGAPEAVAMPAPAGVAEEAPIPLGAGTGSDGQTIPASAGIPLRAAVRASGPEPTPPTARPSSTPNPWPKGGAAARTSSMPNPWPKGAGSRALALDARFFWGDKQLAVGSFDGDETVSVGDAKDATFALEAPNLSTNPFPLARRVDGAWYVRFDSSMDGELLRDGKVERLSDLARARKARPAGEGLMEVELPEDGAAWVDLGNIRAELCFRPKVKPLPTQWSAQIDYKFVNLLLAVFAIFGASIIGFANSARDVDVTADDLFSNQARLTKLLLTPPEQRQNPFLEKLKLKAPDSGEKAERARGDEGKMGKQDAPERNTRSAPRAIKPDDKEVVKNQGLLAMLGSGSNAGLSTIVGKAGLGGDLKGAIGGITGQGVGDAHGFGGLGLKGTGLGGGGQGTTIGVGDVGTKGRGGGLGDYGKGMGGLGQKGGSDVTIDSSSAIVVGYDKELVRRVINSHRAQIRYCYENELIRNPKLSGRIQVKFTISGDGTVPFAQVTNSTMGNAQVESCIAARFRSWQFPPPKGGGTASVTYPFVFSPPT